MGSPQRRRGRGHEAPLTPIRDWDAGVRPVDRPLQYQTGTIRVLPHDAY